MWHLRMPMTKIYEDVIIRKITEINKEFAEYYRLHRKFCSKKDNDKAQLIQNLLLDTCKSILKEIKIKEKE